jgi:hypothetical protein
MIFLFRALNAELLKLKRTLAFRVIFLLPVLVAVLQFFIVWRTKKFAPNFDLWQTITNSSLQIWAVFMLPLLVTLETALLNGIEHSDNQWKHMFALPVPRSALYLAKLLVAQALILISTAALSVLIAIVGVSAKYIRPELANAGQVPVGQLVKYTLLIWLAAWFIISIHTWISVRWSGFPIPLGAGIGGTFFALFAASAAVGKYYPWLLPMNLFIDGRFASAIVIGISGGVIAALIGCYDFARRDVA